MGKNDEETNKQTVDVVKETINLFKEEINTLRQELDVLKNGLLLPEEKTRLEKLNVDDFTKILENKTTDLLSNLIIKASNNAINNITETPKKSVADILKFKGNKNE